MNEKFENAKEYYFIIYCRSILTTIKFIQHKHPTPQAPKKPRKQTIHSQKKYKKLAINNRLDLMQQANKPQNRLSLDRYIRPLYIIHSKLEIPSQQPKANKQYLANKG